VEDSSMNAARRPCLIACGIFRQELERIVKNAKLSVDIEYLDPCLHNDPECLENALKKAIEDRRQKHQNNIVIIYGDICLGFQNEMKALTENYGLVKVDALNCIDCLLGGKGKLLEIDPKHEYFFLNPAWIELEFGNRDKTKNIEEAQEEFSLLTGLFLLDTLGDLDDYSKDIEEIREYTGLPVVERKNIGIEGIQKVVLESIESLTKRDL
jgi:hypothetical protein